jgi:hypothetical protein
VSEPLAENQVHPQYSDRTLDGRVRTGNQVARKSGIYSAAIKRGEVPADLRQSVDEFRAGLIADAGGTSALTTIQASYIAERCDLDVCRRMLMNELVTRGLFTAKGRVRSIYDKLLATLNMCDRVSQRIEQYRSTAHVPSALDFYTQRIDNTDVTDDDDPPA